MMVEANMPDSMWNEAYKIAGYIANRTPIKRLGWRTPFEMFIKSMPTMAHMHLFGCRAFPLIHKIPKLAKMSPRAQIGYLCGYDSTNIFRIWLPIQDKVIRIRDVKFDDNKLYHPSDLELSALRDTEVKRVVESLEIPDVINELSRGAEEDLESEYDSNTIVINVPNRSTSRSTQNNDVYSPHQEDKEPSTTPQQLPTPKSTSPTTNPTLSQDITPSTDLQSIENDSESTTQAPIRSRSPGITRSSVSADHDKAHILPQSSKRTRRTTTRNTQAAVSIDPDLTTYFHAFATSIRTSAPVERRTHITELPKEPRTWTELLSHPYKLEFITGCGKEIADLTKIGTFSTIDIPPDLSYKDLLPLM